MLTFLQWQKRNRLCKKKLNENEDTEFWRFTEMWNAMFVHIVKLACELECILRQSKFSGSFRAKNQPYKQELEY